MSRILVVQEDQEPRASLVHSLASAGHEMEEASGGTDAIARLHSSSFDLVLTDLKMKGTDGLDVLRAARTLQPSTIVIVMTAFGSVETAIDAIRNGAADYVQKPFTTEELEVRIARALEVKRCNHEIDYLRHTQKDVYDFDGIVGSSPSLRRVLDMARKVSPTNATVLILGETGSGKELIAGAIHHNSLRKARSIVKVNCAALHENLLESELFGHERGAFTGAEKQRIGRFEQADGGTLFLDEIGDMAVGTQSKILRVLQEHEFERLGSTRTIKVDVRLITATNRDLAAMVRSGGFREDLYYRINVVPIEVPPLRERKEDILMLASVFVRRFSGELKKKVDGIGVDAQKVLIRHDWPGNIRELANTIERAVLLTEGPMIREADLGLDRTASAGSARDEPARPSTVKLPLAGLALGEIERDALIEALKMSNWVQKDAADLLSISPRVINYKIKMLKIERPLRDLRVSDAA